MMSNTLCNILVVIITISLFLLIGVSKYAKYKAILKHFPNMTYFEYTMLGESIRIMPKEEKTE